MRIGLLSDIHGNDLALRAVLDQIECQGGVDGTWVLGDVVAIGHAPVKVLKMLDELPNTQFVRGNTDRYVCGGDRPAPKNVEVIANPSLLQQRIEEEGDFCWTQGAITAAGWFEWLENLPIEYHRQLPDGTRALCVHASPGEDDGPGIYPDLETEKIEDLLLGCESDLICVGHSHRPFSMMAGGKRIINPGSVSNHVGADVRACYAILSCDAKGYDVQFCRVAYDNQKVLQYLTRIKHPARRFISMYIRGERSR